MKRPKYHFLTIISHSRGSSLVALPGQWFGRNPVPTGILVKDIAPGTQVKRVKAKGSPGDIFFTTTLKRGNHCLQARDIYPLRDNDNVLFADAEAQYEAYLQSIQNTQ